MAHQRPLCGPRDDSRVSLALMPFRPFGGLRRPPAAVFCKKASERGVLRYIVRAVLGPVLEYKNHTSLYSGTKTAANQGVQMAKSIAADAKMTRLIVRSPGGSAAAILQAAFDMRLTPVPAHGPVPVMPHGPRRGVAAAGTGDVSSFRSSFGHLIVDCWFLKSPNNYVYNCPKMVCHADFRLCRSFLASNNAH